MASVAWPRANSRRLCEYYGVSSDHLLFGTDHREPTGVALRADEGADVTRVVDRVEAAFADYRYVRALVEP